MNKSTSAFHKKFAQNQYPQIFNYFPNHILWRYGRWTSDPERFEKEIKQDGHFVFSFFLLYLDEFCKAIFLDHQQST